MAIAIKTNTKYYKASWTGMDGKTKSKMTTHRDFVRAVKQANELEAIDHFHDQADAKIFDFMAANGLGADSIYTNFTHRAHIKKDKFKQLLNEVGVEILPPHKQRDKSKPIQNRAKRYRWKKNLLHLDDIIRQEGCTLSYNTVKTRLDRGWSLKDAITKPAMNKSQLN